MTDPVTPTPSVAPAAPVSLPTITSISKPKILQTIQADFGLVEAHVARDLTVLESHPKTIEIACLVAGFVAAVVLLHFTGIKV